MPRGRGRPYGRGPAPAFPQRHGRPTTTTVVGTTEGRAYTVDNRARYRTDNRRAHTTDNALRYRADNRRTYTQ